MKRMIPCFTLLVLISTAAAGQKLSDVDTAKYTINLPGYWRPGNKIWQILSDKLPTVCEELKDKELCGDHCNPKYSIEFIMSEPVILDYYSNHISSGTTSQTYEFVTLYSFSSSLLLMNEKNEVLTRFILADTNEVWRVTHKTQLASYTSRPAQRIYMLQGSSQQDATDNNRWGNRGSGTGGQSPFAYINNNKDKLSPTLADMLKVIDEKIRSW